MNVTFASTSAVVTVSETAVGKSAIRSGNGTVTGIIPSAPFPLEISSRAELRPECRDVGDALRAVVDDSRKYCRNIVPLEHSTSGRFDAQRGRRFSGSARSAGQTGGSRNL